MLTIGIYAIINTVNSKRYIGSSVDLEQRRKEHWRALMRGDHDNTHLQRSANKHGVGAFVFEVLETCGIDELISREQCYLDESQPEYNMLPRAHSMLGTRMSEAVKEKISRALRGRSSPMKGKRHTEAAKLKMSRSQKGNRHLWGHKHSLESRAKMSRSHLGQPAPNKGQSHSAETRAKISATLKGRPQSDSHRMRRAETMKGNQNWRNAKRLRTGRFG